MEIGIEPTVRHGADLGYIPVVVTDACGAGHPEAAERSIAGLRFTGDAMLTDVQAITQQLQHRKQISAHGQVVGKNSPSALGAPCDSLSDSGMFFPVLNAKSWRCKE